MARTVNGHKAEVLIDRVLEDYLSDETEVFFAAMSQAGKQAKKDIQNTNAFKDISGDYRRGWSIRTKREKYGINVLIYNKLKPGLTHLLEKGHVTRNGTGRRFRDTPAHAHIAKAREKAEDYLLDELAKRL